MSDDDSKRKNYTAEFKREVVRLVTHQGYTFSQAASSVNINRIRYDQKIRVLPVMCSPQSSPCQRGRRILETIEGS